MKKWMAFLVSVVMMVTLALPAMAADSPGALEEEINATPALDVELEPGWDIAVLNDDETGKIIAIEAIEAAAGEEGEDAPNTAVQDTVAEFIGLDPEDEEAYNQLTEEEKELLEALEDFEFITLPTPVALTNGEELRYTLDGTEDGPDVPNTITASIDALKDVEDLTGYYFLVVNPVNNHFAVVPAEHADPNNPLNGVVTADLPMLGYVSMIEGDVKEELQAEVDADSVKVEGETIDGTTLTVEIVSIFNDAEKGNVADEVVRKVNNPLIKGTVQGTIADLLRVDAEDDNSMESLTDEQRAELAELADYEFMTSFAEAVLTDGTNQWYTLNGKPVSAVITIPAVDPGTEGVTSVENLAGYELLVINPEVNESGINDYVRLPLTQAIDFDPMTGFAKIEIPFLGSLSLIKKVDRAPADDAALAELVVEEVTK